MEMTGGFKVEARGAGDARGGYWRSTGLSHTYVQKVPGMMYHARYQALPRIKTRTLKSLT